jgi:hypothetical protein
MSGRRTAPPGSRTARSSVASVGFLPTDALVGLLRQRQTDATLGLVIHSATRAGAAALE